MGGNLPRGRYDFDDISGLAEDINPLLDHGLFLGLTDDDHSQYLLATENGHHRLDQK